MSACAGAASLPWHEALMPPPRRVWPPGHPQTLHLSVTLARQEGLM